jgi:tricorn protease
MRKFLPLSLLAAIAAQSSWGQSSFLTKPDIHGDTVVFTAEGDLWLGSVSGQTAHRITSDAGVETDARFSPDGNWIAFSASYDGGRDVYVMPKEGGPPKRLTFDPLGSVGVQGWTPDGKSVLFRSSRGQGIAEVRRLFTVSAEGGIPQPLAVPRGDFGSLAPNGMLAYVPVSFEWANWFHYQGGSSDKVWLADLNAKTFKKLTNDAGVDTTPVWVGKEIYFISERSGSSNLWRLDPKTGAAKQCTFYSDAAVRYLSSDGSTVIFQHGAHLATFSAASGKVSELEFALASDRIHERDQRVALASEVGPANFPANGGAIGPVGNGIAIGPTGKRVLLEARGQIVSVAAEAGDMRVLENKPGTRARFPAWAPDGKHFAFLSDRSGENEIWIGDATVGGEPRLLTHGLAANPFPFTYSPDGKWIGVQDRNGRTMLIDAASGAIKVIGVSNEDQAYDASPGAMSFSPDSKLVAFSNTKYNWIFGIDLYEISSGKTAMVSNPGVNTYAPAFDSTGKFLVCLADTNLNPTFSNLTGKYYLDKTTTVEMLPLNSEAKSPFLPKNDEEGVQADSKPKPEAAATGVDWDFVGKRVLPVPLPAGHYASVDSYGDHLLVLGPSDNPDSGSPSQGSSSVISYDLSTRSATTIISGVDMFQKSFDGKKILYASGRQISVHDLTPAPTSMAAGALNLAPYTLTYKPRWEWKQIFEESWRIARDFYFDPNMHGLDWGAIRRKYEDRLHLVGDRGDLSALLKDMVSELNTGHAYIEDPSRFGRRLNIGFLGADFEPVAGAKAVKIVKLLKGDPWDPDVASPLSEPGLGVKEGDYIVGIAGQAIDPDKDINEMMLGTQGQTVALMVNATPSLTGARTVRVRPLSSEQTLRYEDWVMGRMRYVEEHGGSNFGYAHIPDMSTGGLVGFLKGQIADVFKTAMIYDTRYNGGGFVSSLLLQDIGSSPTSWFKPRYGAPWTREGWAVIGHKVALCNEYNFSDGELFIEDWKRMGLGPVVGTRTGGGEVGSGGGYEMIDHGSIYIPNYGAYWNGEWMIEGSGATPTISVEEDPQAVMAGKDPQLDRAIEVLKAELAKSPVSIPQHPPFRTMRPSAKG